MLSSFNKFKIISLISLGSAFEFYDFMIYGIFSTYMANSFFPHNINNPYVNFIGVLSIFCVGYVARPIGGLIFGNIADKYGRKYSFSITLIIMAAGTCLVGLIPTYNQIGIIAPILLLLLRIIQGASMGAELPVSTVFVFEHLSLGKNIFYGATLFGLSNIGLLLGNTINYELNNSLSSNEINQFGWRIPFILGGILGIIAVYLRKKLTETPIFKQMQVIKKPWMEIFVNYKKSMATSVLLSLSYSLCVNFGFVLLFSVLEQLYHVPNKILALITLVSSIVFCFVDSIIGFIADRLHIKLLSIFLAGVLQFSIGFYCVLTSYAHQNYIAGFISMIWLTIATSCFDSTIPNILPRLFPNSVRATGVAGSYGFGLAISAVITVILSTLVISKTWAIWLLPLLIFIIQLSSVAYLFNLKQFRQNNDCT